MLHDAENNSAARHNQSAFAKLREATISFSMYVCLFSWLPVDGLPRNLISEYLSRLCRGISGFRRAFVQSIAFTIHSMHPSIEKYFVFKPLKTTTNMNYSKISVRTAQ